MSVSTVVEPVALRALWRQHQRRALAHDVVFIDEDDFAGAWVDALGGFEVREEFGAGGEADDD